MYSTPFYLTTPVGNNAFSFDKRTNKQLFVPSLKKISSFDEIELGNEIAFEDYDFNDVLSSQRGLKNFYEMSWNNIPLFLFDNHNHAFYFWYLARHRGIIGEDNILFHVDEHADTRDNQKFLYKPESEDLQKVFEFTNYVLNVGDYILPACHEGLIGEVIQIRNETNLQSYLQNIGKINFSPSYEGESPRNEGEGLSKKDIILNLDLDFFQPDLDFIDYDTKKKVILDIARQAKVITVATSPFFIEQKLALEVFCDIFKEEGGNF